MISLENDIMERSQALGLPETAYLPSNEELATPLPETHLDASESLLGTIPEASEEAPDSGDGETANSTSYPLYRYIHTYIQPDPTLCNYADISIENFPNLRSQMDPYTWSVFKQHWNKNSASSDLFEQNWLQSLSLVGCSGIELEGRYGRFLNCRIRKGKHGVYTCGDVKLCEYCAYKRKKALTASYSELLSAGRWDHLTISFPLFTAPTRESVIHDHWDACKEIIRQLRHFELVDGALYQEELTLKQLYPKTLINPHCHVLCLNLEDSTSLGEAIVKGVAGHENARGIPLMSTPDCQIKRIATPTALKNALGYLRKPTDFVEAYQSGIATCTACKQDFTGLNKNLKEYLDLLWRAQHGRMQSLYLGSLHPNSKKLLVPITKKAKRRNTKKKRAKRKR